jgi:hypothetical protein
MLVGDECEQKDGSETKQGSRGVEILWYPATGFRSDRRTDIKMEERTAMGMRRNAEPGDNDQGPEVI